jgi:hypothetical protein
MQSKINELDVVALTVDLPEQQLLRGQVGTIVMDLGPDAAEVEFVDPTGKTYALLTLPKSQLLRLHHSRIGAA